MKQIDMEKKKPQSNAMCSCIPQETVIENVRLAAAYVPYQFLCALFAPVQALRRGTAFPELYSPYKGEDKKSRPCQLGTMQGERF